MHKNMKSCMADNALAMWNSDHKKWMQGNACVWTDEFNLHHHSMADRIRIY